MKNRDVVQTPDKGYDKWIEFIEKTGPDLRQAEDEAYALMCDDPDPLLALIEKGEVAISDFKIRIRKCDEFLSRHDNSESFVREAQNMPQPLMKKAGALFELHKLELPVLDGEEAGETRLSAELKQQCESLPKEAMKKKLMVNVRFQRLLQQQRKKRVVQGCMCCGRLKVVLFMVKATRTMTVQNMSPLKIDWSL